MVRDIINLTLAAGWWIGIYDGDLMSLANLLGHPVPLRSGGPKLDILTVRDRHEARDNSLSSRYGTGAFPFHNDAAHHAVVPKYVVLRYDCDNPSTRGTVLMDFREALHQRQLDVLSRELWVVRTGKRGFLSSIVEGNYLRYDPAIMTPALCTSARGEMILQTVFESARKETVLWTPQLTVVIDNHRVLHARQTRPQAESSKEERSIERILVRSYELENG